MTPAELQSLLIDRLPTLPGVESAVAWPGRPYGLSVTVAGAGTVYWTITGASNTAPAAAPGDVLGPQPVPELSGGTAATAEVEQAMLTAIKAGDPDGNVVRAKRYSTQDITPAVGYGATIDFTDSWRLFLACVGTAGRGEELRELKHFKPSATLY